MTENIILDWFNEDEQLSNMINAIDATKSLEQQALDAFLQVSTHYGLPKYPADFNDEYYERFEKMGIDNPRSVFEEATILKFLEPDEDPRGLIMVALYNVKNGTFIDIDEAAIKHFGSQEEIPSNYYVCFIGDGFAGQLHFLKETESWIELGAKSMIRVFKQ